MKFGGSIVQDLQARAPWYRSDWTEGFSSGYRIFAPSVYIFFASVVPALAFSEQIDYETHGAFNGVHVLVSTAMGGLMQTFFGGQPLLILGVAEPIVLMYGFMYQFADSQNFTDVFVPWCTWSLIWCSIFLALFAATGLCEHITKFTRFSGELFGMLIAVLFMQQAIKGVVQEFQVSSPCRTAAEDAAEAIRDAGGDEAAALAAEADILNQTDCVTYTSAERIVNGLWAVVLSVGTLLTSMLVHTGRSWRFFKGGVRSFLADYGVPLMVVIWSGVSYALQDATPKGIPRRLSLPNPWDDEGQRNWDVLSRLGSVSGVQIAYSVIPGTIIAALFYFDHNVSAQLAQQKDFQLVRPTSYSWDMLVLAILTGVSGLIGVPPANCVIPQAPMHTKALVTLKKMLVQRDERIRSKSQANLIALEKGAAAPEQATASDASKVGAAVGSSGSDHRVDDVKAVPFGDGLEEEYIRLENGVVPLNVKEQRLSNLIQTLLVAASLGATPLVKKIPKSVLWGYFAYMAVESLPGSEFWDRILLVFTDKRKRLQMLSQPHPVYLETVPYRTIMLFTAVQFVYLLAVWGVTWAGAVGNAFPFLIIILIPIRQYLMPKVFDRWALSQLDAADYEEAPPAPEWVVREAAEREHESVAPDEYEERERLQEEMPGRAAVRHHLTAEEMRQRSLRSRASINEGDGVPRASFARSHSQRSHRVSGHFQLGEMQRRSSDTGRVGPEGGPEAANGRSTAPSHPHVV